MGAHNLGKMHGWWSLDHTSTGFFGSASLQACWRSDPDWTLLCFCWTLSEDPLCANLGHGQRRERSLGVSAGSPETDGTKIRTSEQTWGVRAKGAVSCKFLVGTQDSASSWLIGLERYSFQHWHRFNSFHVPFPAEGWWGSRHFLLAFGYPNATNKHTGFGSGLPGSLLKHKPILFSWPEAGYDQWT